MYNAAYHRGEPTRRRYSTLKICEGLPPHDSLGKYHISMYEPGEDLPKTTLWKYSFQYSAMRVDMPNQTPTSNR